METQVHRKGESRRLQYALIITAGYFAVEVLGGFLTNSLALLSDAGHMLSDVAALTLSLIAFRMAGWPADTRRTFGYHRVEIVAALLNGLTLWLIVGVIFHEAYQRLYAPPEVKSLGMLVIAAIGLGVNVVAGLTLHGAHRENLNIRGAFLHVLGDALGSVGAIAAGIAMLTTGWYLADPLVSLFIGLLILYTSWHLIKESMEILLQSAPREISIEVLKDSMEAIEGVHKVHDLHVWAVTSGVFILSAHAVIDPADDFHHILSRMERHLQERFNIRHTTIQLETEDREMEEFQAF